MIFKLLMAPVSAPMAGFRFLCHQFLDMAEREMYNVEQIRDDLLELQNALEEGELTEAEYAEQEEAIMVRYRAAMARQRGL